MAARLRPLPREATTCRSTSSCIDALTGHEIVLGNHAWRNATYVEWLPDGKSLLVNAQEANGEATNQVWLVSASGGNRGESPTT